MCEKLRPVRLLLPWLCLVATSTPAAEQTLNGHKFTLPEGFQIELVAGPPLIDRPISADFDEQGRLYVTESSGTNDKSDVQLATSHTGWFGSKTPIRTAFSIAVPCSPTR